MAKKEFSTDFSEYPNQDIQDNDKTIIEDATTGAEFWIKFSKIKAFVLEIVNLITILKAYFVRFDEDQTLNNTQKAQARTNIDTYSKDETLQLVDVFDTKTATSTENGKGIKSDGTLENVSACVTKEYDITGAEKIRINGFSPVNHALYVFLDSNSNPILPVGELNQNKSYVAFDVIKPANAERVLICGTLNFPAYCITLTEKYALKSDLINEVITEETPSGNGTGYRLKSDLNSEVNANYRTNDYNVTPGQVKHLSGTSGVGYALAFAIDGNGFPSTAILPNGSDVVSDYTYTVPAGIYSIKVCGTVANPPLCKVVTQKYALKTDLEAKQNALISGTNIKTINGASLLGSGNIDIQGGSGGGLTAEQVVALIGNYVDAQFEEIEEYKADKGGGTSTVKELEDEKQNIADALVIDIDKLAPLAADNYYMIGTILDSGIIPVEYYKPKLIISFATSATTAETWQFQHITANHTNIELLANWAKIPSRSEIEIMKKQIKLSM